MRKFSQWMVLALALVSAPALRSQADKPVPSPTAPATSSALPATNPAPATNNPAPVPAGGNASVMLLKQGHTESVRARAAQELGKQGDRTTIPDLADALKDPSSRVRREVVLALAQFHQSAVLPPLEQAAQDMDEGVRITAVQCLVGYYTGVLPPVGWTGFVKKNWQRAATHFESDDTKIDPGVSVDPTVINTLVAVMKQAGSNDAAREAAKGLGILLAKAAAPDLVAEAHSSNTDLAREALNSLAKIKDKDSGPKLVDLLDSPNKDVRRDACVTVGILRTKEALTRLQTIYQTDTDEKHQVAAMQGLAYLGDKSSVPLFVAALQRGNKEIRQGAAEGLARSGDAQHVGALQNALEVEKDAGPRLAMQFALSALGKEDAVRELVTELGSKTRSDVARTYLIELSRDPVFLLKLYPYLQSPENTIRKRLCEVLMYSGDQSSLVQLDRLEHDPDTEVATAALKAKRAIRARADVSTAAKS